MKGVFYDDDKLKEVLDLEYPTNSWAEYVARGDSRTKFQKWFERSDVGNAVLSKRVISSDLLLVFREQGVSATNRSDFFNCVVAYNNSLIKDLGRLSDKTKIKRYPNTQRLSVHLWLGDKSLRPEKPSGLIAIVDVEAQI